MSSPRGRATALLLFLLPRGCASDPAETTAPRVLRPDQHCSDYADTDIASFEDPNLETAIRARPPASSSGNLTCELLATLTELTANQRGIASLVGIQNLTGLRHLELAGNSITDLGPLSGLESLSHLELSANAIVDITALSGLTSLELLVLANNPDLVHIQALLDNTGLGAGDDVWLLYTSVSCEDVSALQARGVMVAAFCP